MYSGMIGKIDKAHRYAAERDRFQFHDLRVTIRGNNDEHTVTLQDGVWHCGCDFFRHEETCAHTMALEVLLEGMVKTATPVS
ncbi:MAG: hypothetical protein O3A10_04070 [Chloroflexi bacterium]|nr:hypothetical protein [Chloroflexota bacterium]MDA1146739.1 hypothetical protein [Chloroflexota bacterium]MQC82892.1 hypothetical protein [Chloroflexota bacterium]